MGTPSYVPPSSNDTRALVIAVGSLLVAGAVVMVFLFWATRTGPPPEGPDGERHIAVGPVEVRTKNLTEEGPLYFADPFGGPGFWLAYEGNEIVALHVLVPGRADCSVNWRGRDDTFVDCDDQPIQSTQLDRYEVELPVEGDRDGEVVVDVNVLTPAPGA